jgi:hypothetical protein
MNYDFKIEHIQVVSTSYFFLLIYEQTFIFKLNKGHLLRRGLEYILFECSRSTGRHRKAVSIERYFQFCKEKNFVFK